MHSREGAAYTLRETRQGIALWHLRHRIDHAVYTRRLWLLWKLLLFSARPTSKQDALQMQIMQALGKLEAGEQFSQVDAVRRASAITLHAGENAPRAPQLSEADHAVTPMCCHFTGGERDVRGQSQAGRRPGVEDSTGLSCIVFNCSRRHATTRRFNIHTLPVCLQEVVGVFADAAFALGVSSDAMPML